MPNENERVSISDDGESGYIEHLSFRCRTLHRQLTGIDEAQRLTVVRNALDIGAEVLARVDRHGDLEQLGQAVERLDVESRPDCCGHDRTSRADRPANDQRHDSHDQW